MNIECYCEELAKQFIKNPANYITEADLQYKLASLINQDYSPINTEGLNIEGSGGYKDRYRKEIEESTSKMDRAHLEVSVEEGERIDLVVFKKDNLTEFDWIRNGSKRFREENIDAAVELKFVKNKRFFPKTKKNDDIEEKSVKNLKDIVNLDKNNIKDDIKELNRLKCNHTYLLIFSNNNYLFNGGEHSLSEEEKEHKWYELYKKLGEAAKQKIKCLSNNDIRVMYVHPRMKEETDYWIV